ncbi:protein kinase domain-containing protein [Haematococcus lacustris]|uniref:mitogen-activated protein kinase kinase n=1 Tax=Haematococcus lacustris TaxID=44745 RepID=A0A699ZUT6_HAELA|nr:protein kinase domain-containing protein [Haematococcus lacustris]
MQVVAGLVHLHKELHVVHRDIKPSNLLLTSTGALKISDFGVSGQLTSSVSNCLSWVGTVTYMSPERIKGDQYSFDSDMWSLGLTLVEWDASAAQQPLGFWELLEYIVEEAVPVLPRGDPRFSAELCDFVAKCLVKDARQRATIDVLSKHAFLRTHKGTNLAELLSWAVNAS